MSFSVFTVFDVAFLLLAAVVWASGGYKAFASRNILVVPAYRRLANAAAYVGIPGSIYLLALAWRDLGIGGSELNSNIVLVSLLVFAPLALGTVDRTVTVGLSFDFFHRDIAHWQRGGRVLCFVVIGTGFVALYVANITYGWILMVAGFSYLTLVLAVSVFRAREDMLLDFIRWLVALVILGTAANTLYLLTGSNVLYLAQAYFFYLLGASIYGNTYHFELSSFFQAPSGFVYKTYTDIGMLTKITRSYRTVTLHTESDGRDVVDFETQILGVKVDGTLRRRHIFPKGLEEEVMSKWGAGATSFTFVPEEDGTRVTAEVDFEPKGTLAKILGGFTTRAIRRQFEADLAVGKAYCEANKPR